jgi:hypothetical protein
MPEQFAVSRLDVFNLPMSAEDAWAGAVDSSQNIVSYVSNFRYIVRPCDTISE